MQVWNVLQDARWKYITQKLHKKSPYAHYRTTFFGLHHRNWGMHRQWENNLLNSNISSTCPHNMVNCGSLTAEISWRVWGTPANFNGFFASWLCYCADVALRRSAKLCTMFVHFLGWYTIYIFGGCCPLSLTEFCQMQNSLYVPVLCSPILVVLLHGTRAVGISQTATFSRGCHLYSAERPSHWASAHILVFYCCGFFFFFLLCFFFLLLYGRPM